MRPISFLASLLIAPVLVAQDAPSPLPYVTVMPNFQDFSQSDKEFEAGRAKNRRVELVKK